MPGRKHIFRDFLPLALLVASLGLLVWTIWASGTPGDTDFAAAKLEKSLSGRMEILDGYMSEAIETPSSEWLELEGLPKDMVIYRFVNDSLQSWNHQFTISNDDISMRVFFQRLTNPRTALSSPLSGVSGEPSYVNFGSKWYLVKYIEGEGCKVIGGLEIQDTRSELTVNGVNPELRLGDKFSINPLSSSGGSAVCVNGIPEFKVLYDSFNSFSVSYPGLVWLSFAFFLLAAVGFLATHRRMRNFFISMIAILGASAAMYLWGFASKTDFDIFSPTVYADGTFLFSLGAVLILNIAIVSFILCIYLVRNEILRWLKRAESGLLLTVCSIALLAAIFGVVIYTQYAFRSIIQNSGITLELYKMSELSIYTGVVYASFITLLMTIPLFLQMLRPGLKEWTGIRYDAVSRKSRSAFAVIFSIYLVVIAAILGFRKEEDKLEVWANRLSIERDISLELELRSVENSIASDVFIAPLSILGNSATTILNRITDNYLYGLSNNYDISVFVFNDSNATPANAAFFQERVSTGTPISETSRFLYTVTGNGHVRYTGVFLYFHQNFGVTRMLVTVEPKNLRESVGYARILGISAPGQVIIPAQYSYARYKSRDIVNFSGSYPYPTIMDESLARNIYEEGVRHFSLDGYIHFVNFISEDEIVTISRKKIGVTDYALAFVFIALFAFFALSVMTLRKRRRTEDFEKNYYRSRVTIVIIGSLTITLISMALASVLFVYKRNDANLRTSMSDKINSIQALIENNCREAVDFNDLNTPDFNTTLQAIGSITGVDITLYTPDGRVFLSTDTDIYDLMIAGPRINDEAFYNISYRNKRYFIGEEELESHRYYSLYAPVFNEKGEMIAILGTPYTDENHDFEMEAVRHSVTILTVFILLLILTRMMASAIVNKMFKPLVMMGKKMKASNIEDLDYIEYDRDDEIATLVKSYNRMVTDLSESTKKLAQAERDKAWSSMARQVAHEIKNPLTPMKLQLQRIIRLKAKDDPQWQEKFDEVAKVVLEHIDILTDTANEFSTFAKLYSEEPSVIDIDAILKDEISMFDSKGNIDFSYIGLEKAVTMGPKPQLTRVFVNLLGNAVQAVEGQEDAKIVVSLRKSTVNGYYDIVFEDNGPGVSKENVSKLFTPNFTTKSGGTGLGLAISRSILEKCNATIAYSKSFTLGGACFKITYPIISDGCKSEQGNL